MAHNTDDCKEYLVKHYPHTKKSEWKRVRKYKDNLGNECRDFNNTTHNHQISLKSTYYGLYEFVSVDILNAQQPKVYDQVSLHERVFGGGATEINKKASNEEKFLHILKNGINWEEDQGNRAAYDFAQNIDFNSFVLSHKYLLRDYLEYMYGATMFALDLDETYMPNQISAKGYDDTFIDLLEVLTNIVQAYTYNNLRLNGNKDVVININNTMANVKSMMDCEEEEQYLECERIIAQINKQLQILI